MDITSQDLRAAILDQVVAGKMHGKSYAFVAVSHDKGWGVGIAVLDEPGYHQVGGDLLHWSHRDEASEFCEAMNRHIGLSDDEEMKIIASSLRGSVTEEASETESLDMLRDSRFEQHYPDRD